jgi:hypothetical protein
MGVDGCRGSSSGCGVCGGRKRVKRCVAAQSYRLEGCCGISLVYTFYYDCL